MIFSVTSFKLFCHYLVYLFKSERTICQIVFWAYKLTKFFFLKVKNSKPFRDDIAKSARARRDRHPFLPDFNIEPPA